MSRGLATAAICWTGVILGGMAPLLAQGAGDGGAAHPPPPANRILDDAELFKRAPERLTAISERLVAFEKEHGIPIYLVVYAGVIRGNVTQRAQELYEAWVGAGRDGIVIVCDTDTREVDLGLPGQQPEDLEGGRKSVTRLPAYRMVPVLAALRMELDGVRKRVDYLDGMTRILTERLGAVLDESGTERQLWSNYTLAAVLVGAGAMVVLLGLWANRRLRAMETKEREKFYFPEVLVGIRLGAPFGGGRVSEVDFSAPKGLVRDAPQGGASDEARGDFG